MLWRSVTGSGEPDARSSMPSCTGKTHTRSKEQYVCLHVQVLLTGTFNSDPHAH